MSEEFNLSEKIVDDERVPTFNHIHAPWVKDFVKLLKEDTGCNPINSREEQIVRLFKERINKLAGDKLQ